MIAAALTEHTCTSALLHMDPELAQGDEQAICSLYAEVLEKATGEFAAAGIDGIDPQDLAHEIMLEILEAAKRHEHLDRP